MSRSRRSEPKAWRYVKRILAIVAGTALAVLVGSILFARFTGGQLLSIQTGSMVPYFAIGDLAVVYPTGAANLKKGDIITYKSPQNETLTLTHRIVATPAQLGAGRFQTKGDANDLPDTPINSGQIVGKVTYAIPRVGKLVNFLRSPVGVSLIIYAPAAIVILDEIRRLAVYYASQQPYTAPGRTKTRKHPPARQTLYRAPK